MRTADQDPNNYIIIHSDLFAAAYLKFVDVYPRLHDALAYIEWQLQRTPDEVGLRRDIFPDRHIRVAVTPPVENIPTFRVLLEIGEREVKLWSLSMSSPTTIL